MTIGIALELQPADISSELHRCYLSLLVILKVQTVHRDQESKCSQQKLTNNIVCGTFALQACVCARQAIAAKISSKTLKEKTERQGLLGECHTVDLPRRPNKRQKTMDDCVDHCDQARAENMFVILFIAGENDLLSKDLS
jgi:hypothetical protein